MRRQSQRQPGLCERQRRPCLKRNRFPEQLAKRQRAQQPASAHLLPRPHGEGSGRAGGVGREQPAPQFSGKQKEHSLEASLWERVSPSQGSAPGMLEPRCDEGCGRLGVTPAAGRPGWACRMLRPQTTANRKALLLVSTAPPPRPGLPF